MSTASPMIADESAQRWLFEQRKADLDERQVLLVGLTQSGCSGWAYQPSWVKALPPGDFIVGQVPQPEGRPDLSIAYPSAHSDKMGGVVLSFLREGLSSRLVFQNPHVTAACGCGASVHFDPTHA